MVLKYKQPQEPTYYKVALDCNHQPIMTPDEIKGALVDDRHNGIEFERTMICPLCKQHAPGSCDYTMLHKILFATPLFQRQVKEQQQQHQEPKS